MRNTGYLLVCFLLSSCLPKQDQIFVKHFLGPGLNKGEAILHEYTCNQKQPILFKYLLLQRDSAEKDLYHYLSFNGNMEFIFGATEKRETGQTRTLKRYFPEQDANPSKYHILVVDVDVSIPDYITLGRVIHSEMNYKSLLSEKTFYSESDLQVDGMDSILLLGRQTEVLKLSSVEKGKTVIAKSNKETFYAQNITLYYGFTRGLVGMDVKIEDFPSLTFRLKDIHKRDEYERLLKKHGKKHPNINSHEK